MIPQLLLEEIFLGEKKEEDYYEKYGKEELQKALLDLKKSNEEILDSYKADFVFEEITKKSEKERNVVKMPKKIKYSPWKFSLAAMLAFALASPIVIRSLNMQKDSNYIRVKGNANPQIKLYRQSGDNAILLKNGENARENDVIQITYTPGTCNYGLIFSVDGNGNITRHFPENSWSSQKLEKTGGEVPLSFSYALDDAPDYECFVFVASNDEFDLSKIEEISTKSYSIDFFKKAGFLPDNCKKSVFVLKKK